MAIDLVDFRADLLPRTMPFLPKCPQAVAIQQLRLAARYFCRQTEIFQVILDTFPTVADQAAYTLELPVDGSDDWPVEFLRVLAVKIDDVAVKETRWTFGPDSVLTFLAGSIPAESGKDVEVSVVFQPLPACFKLPQWMLDKWSDAIIARAIFKLKQMEGEPWGDAKGAAQWGRDYDQEESRARVEAVVGRQSGEIRVQVPPFV